LSCAENCPHTAHEPSLARICYRYHPFFGHEVRVVRRFRRLAADSLIVALDDGLQIAIPPWMLDARACEALVVAPAPRIALTALRQLRDLLDAQTLETGPASSYAEASPPPGGDDASPDHPDPSTPTL